MKLKILERKSNKVCVYALLPSQQYFGHDGTTIMKLYSCIEAYSYSCFNPLSNERKSMFKSGDSRAV